MLIQNLYYFLKLWAFVFHPRANFLSDCSKNTTLHSINNSLNYHDTQQLTKDLREGDITFLNGEKLYVHSERWSPRGEIQGKLKCCLTLYLKIILLLWKKVSPKNIFLYIIFFLLTKIYTSYKHCPFLVKFWHVYDICRVRVYPNGYNHHIIYIFIFKNLIHIYLGAPYMCRFNTLYKYLIDS